MSTQVAPISQGQQKKWADAIQEFANEIFAKYPSLDGTFIPVLIEEVRALGLEKEYISKRSLWAAFRNCVGDDRIILPKQEPVLTPEVIEKIKNSFPPVIKKVERELSQREKNSLSGVHEQSGRLTASERLAESKRTDDRYTGAQNTARLNNLRREYRELKSKAETAVVNPRSHAQNGAERKRLLTELAANPRFAEVRE